jgi:hypothetical protein
MVTRALVWRPQSADLGVSPEIEALRRTAQGLYDHRRPLGGEVRSGFNGRPHRE